MRTIKFEKVEFLKYISWILAAIIISYFNIKGYYNLAKINLERFWIVVPSSILFVNTVLQNIYNKKICAIFELSLITFASVIVSIGIVKIDFLNTLFIVYEAEIISILFLLILIIIAIRSFGKKESDSKIYRTPDDLFNLFYINTSKVHEIAMLIDNRIMRTVENQKNTQHIQKYGFSSSLFKTANKDIGINHAIENINQKSVYESFDVKMTKSIMLRTIYSSIKDNEISFGLGNILLFKNIKLKQINTDDTVLVLNVLKDSNMKQMSSDDNFELNLSKMMEEMLVDFTIDYTFEDSDCNYLIRIPYNSKEYFENSYSHSDLQFGKLSIIGIYRGYLNFSEIESISTKFLDYFSSSYKDELNRNSVKKNSGLTQSSSQEKDKDLEFDIQPTKLEGHYHLVDLMAIIQEINLEDGNNNG